MGFFDSAKNLYDSAKEKAAEALGDEGVEALNSLKSSAIKAGTQLKRAANDALNDSDSEFASKVRDFRDGVRREMDSSEIKLTNTENDDDEPLPRGPVLVPAICPQCGAPVKVDPNMEKAECYHCGTSFVVSSAVNEYKVERANIRAEKVEVHKKGTVEATLSHVEKMREKKREEKRLEEERQRREEARRAKEAALARKRRKIWFRKNGVKASVIGLLLIAICIVGGKIAVDSSRRGKIAVGIASYDLEKNNYEFAQEKLKQAGFTDIKLIADPDLVIGLLNSDGQVKTVSIGSSTSFSSGSLFKPDEPVIITYHTFPASSNPTPVPVSTPSISITPRPTATPRTTATPKPTSTPRPTPTPVPSVPKPVMPGTSLSKVLEVAGNYGLSRAFSDENFGHGTKQCSLQSNSGGLTLDVIYDSTTMEVLCGNVVTFNGLASNSEQASFIKGISSVLCPQSDEGDVSTWVSNNVGGSAVTSIGGYEYEVALGPSQNLLYYAGVSNWEDWDISVN